MSSLLSSTALPFPLASASPAPTPSQPLPLAGEICTYLQRQALPTTLNFDNTGEKNLFATFMPDTPDIAVAISERPGMSPLSTLVGGVGAGPRLPEPRLDRPFVQIMTRAPSDQYLAGNALAEAVFGALEGVGETILNPPDGAYFHWIFALQSPAYLGQQSGRERNLWSQNFRVLWTNPQR